MNEEQLMQTEYYDDPPEWKIEKANLEKKIDDLIDFAIWMTGCSYDFCQHDYFCKKRDELLKGG